MTRLDEMAVTIEQMNREHLALARNFGTALARQHHAIMVLRRAFKWLEKSRNGLDVAPDWYTEAREAFPEVLK